MKRRTFIQCCIAMAWLTGVASAAVDFAGLLTSPESHWNGPAANGVTVEGEYGPEVVGTFASGGVEFTNTYDQTYGSWRGFAYSNQTDTTTPGYTNQYSAITGSGHGTGNDTYALGFGHWDLEENFQTVEPFDATSSEHLFALPTLELPYGYAISSTWITNTTYAALSMLEGDSFAKAFGGETGTDPDWLKITAYGTDESGTPLGELVEFYLADYRAAGSADDYVLTDWAEWDLSGLADARWVHFNMTSSDIGMFGMNTPANFALDDLQITATQLPGDFNGDLQVDQTDYTVWRNTLGTTVDRRGMGADADLSGVVDAGDYQVWKTQFGAMATGAIDSLSTVPEPTSAAMGILVIGLAIVCRSMFTH